MREQHGDSPMTTPTTDAGRALLAVSNGEDPILPDDWYGAILAIEQESAAPHVARVAALEKALATVEAGRREVLDDHGETVHRCPPEGSGVMPCCGLPPFEAPRTDRLATDPLLVTCTALATPEPPRSEEPTCVLWVPGVVPCGKTEEEHPKRGHRFIAAFTTPAPGGRDE